MGRTSRSVVDGQASGLGSTRTLIATAFAVWALLLQSLLPVAGAFASDSGNTFLVELCTTAGIQTIALDGGEGSPDQPLKSKPVLTVMSASGVDVPAGPSMGRDWQVCLLMPGLWSPGTGPLGSTTALMPRLPFNPERRLSHND